MPLATAEARREYNRRYWQEKGRFRTRKAGVQQSLVALAPDLARFMRNQRYRLQREGTQQHDSRTLNPDLWLDDCYELNPRRDECVVEVRR